MFKNWIFKMTPCKSKFKYLKLFEHSDLHLIISDVDVCGMNGNYSYRPLPSTYNLGVSPDSPEEYLTVP